MGCDIDVILGGKRQKYIFIFRVFFLFVYRVFFFFFPPKKKKKNQNGQIQGRSGP